MERSAREAGFTLVEMIFVVVIIALISTFVVTRFDSLLIWKQKGDLRAFLNTWEFLFNEALARGESYRLVIDLDNNSYFVRREVAEQGDTVRQVDHLTNLRTKGEKERRGRREEEYELSLDEEFKEEDARQSGALDSLFYGSIYADPEANLRLAIPLEFPALAERKTLTDGLYIRDVRTQEDEAKKGQVFIRFSPRGASEFAVVHFTIRDHVFTAFMNPSTGEVALRDGDLNFEWTLGNEQRHSM